MHIYEYLFTAIIIVTILLASSTMIGSVSEPSRSTSEKEQLKVTAQKIMTQLLLDPGNPHDWGSNIDIDPSNLTAFGLAEYTETTREAYVLDSDKVLRLDSTNPLLIPSSSVINLLNFGYDYGLALEFYPALNVSIPLITSDNYTVRVTSDYGELPIVGANVSARIYYYDSSKKMIENTPLIVDQTSIDGQCIVDFSTLGLPTEMKVLILVVDYYGVRIVKTHIPTWSNVTQAYLIGSNLFFSQPYNISDNEAYEIIATKKGGTDTIENVTYSLSMEEEKKFKLPYVEPSTVALLTVSQDGTKLIFASKEATLTYSSIPGVSLSFPFAYSIERSVTIGGSAYIVRLYLWRMSW